MKRLFAIAAVAVTLTGCVPSTQQEVQLGQEYAAQINQQIPLVRDPEVNRYINVLGDSIARLTGRPELPWVFYVVDAREVNAFAVPGGFIYVNRGLIERTQNLSQLAGVLGHEIGHVVARHSVEAMARMQRAQAGVTLGCVLLGVCQSEIAGAVIDVAGTAVFARFSRQDELEADRIGIENVVRAGIHPGGVPEMFRILLEERQRSPGAVEGWFATHPTEEDRIRETEAIIDEINPAILRTLTRDTPAFQAFRNRVRALPAPPVRR